MNCIFWGVHGAVVQFLGRKRLWPAPHLRSPPPRTLVNFLFICKSQFKGHKAFGQPHSLASLARIEFQFVFPHKNAPRIYFCGLFVPCRAASSDLLSLIKCDPSTSRGAYIASHALAVWCCWFRFGLLLLPLPLLHVGVVAVAVLQLFVLGCLLNTFRYTLAAKSPPFALSSLSRIQTRTNTAAFTIQSHPEQDTHTFPGTHPLSCSGQGKRFKAPLHEVLHLPRGLMLSLEGTRFGVWFQK